MQKRGFTLIELAMVMVIVAVVAFVVGDAVYMGMRAYLRAEGRVEALEKGRVALERVEREVRNAIQISNATASTTTLCFETTEAEVISFRYAGGQITRQQIGAGIGGCPGAAGDVLAADISAFVFSYLQNSGAAEAAPSALTRRIGVSLTSDASGEAMQMQTEVYPRNIW